MDILAFGLPLVTLGLFIYFFIKTRQPRKPKTAKDDPSTRQERAVWAWAKVLSSSQGPVNTFKMARVEMELEIHMPGTPIYQAKTTWLVEEDSLASVAQGKEIGLKVDPQDPKYVYPGGTWAKYLE